MSASAKSPRVNEVDAHPFVRLTEAEIASVLGDLSARLT